MQTLPLTRDLVLIGGGHSHALLLRRWAMDPMPGVRVTVIDPAPAAAYSGMLPGFVAGHYTRQELEIDLVRLAQAAGARLILGRATGIDRQARTVTVAGRPPVAFDVAAIDVGITSVMPDLPGFARHAVPAKPLGPFAQAWEDYRAAATAQRVAVIGGGIAGAELAAAMAHALRGRGAEIRMFDRGRALAAMGQRGRRLTLAALAALGVEVIEGADIAHVGADHVALGDGRAFRSDFTVGTAGARAHGWLTDTDLALKDGFVRVDSRLRSSDPGIFASGDCAHMDHAPRPKAGVYAVRQAPVLWHNLRAALAGTGGLRPYLPQRDYLKLVSLGGQVALAEKWGVALASPALWRWKDRIDRRFMAMFHDLPRMAPPPLPKGPVAAGLRAAAGREPPCGGCGAKVGRGTLAAVLGGIGDDAAVLETGGARQVITTDHLRAVTADPWLMARIAATHALGDIQAMGARPQAAVASLILPRLSPDLQRRTLEEITHGLRVVLDAAGCPLVGGHTTVGEEMTIGLTLTGLCAGAPITLAGAVAGDVLVLTRAIGSGTILAAAMRGRAPGAVVAECHAAMLADQGPAAAVLGGVARAMTDVTGFGLAGHLWGMCQASGTGAVIDPDALPVMPGALALAEAGVRSTLWEENRAAVEVAGAEGARGALLFDPQTCGGLLAAVPAGQAGAVLAALGDGAAVIGRMVAGPPAITCRRGSLQP